MPHTRRKPIKADFRPPPEMDTQEFDEEQQRLAGELSDSGSGGWDTVGTKSPVRFRKPVEVLEAARSYHRTFSREKTGFYWQGARA